MAESAHDVDLTLCIICATCSDSQYRTVSQKGIKTLLRVCDERGCESLKQLLLQHSDVIVHNDCYKSFTDTRNVKKCKQDEYVCTVVKNLRSATSKFSWQDMCFFCVEPAVDDKHITDVVCCRTTEILDNIKSICSDRVGDKFAADLMGRLESCIDLPSADAIYHKSCYVNFLKPKTDNDSVGRPVDSDKLHAFNALCEWLEASCENELVTLDELQQQMRKTAIDVYSDKQLKRKLIERYDDHIVFSHVQGRKNVIGFKNMCEFILSDKWYADRKKGDADESEKIVQAAGKLIASQIREVKSSLLQYPSPDDIGIGGSGNKYEKWVPSLLRELMKKLVPDELKCEALCQSILQAARPRSVLLPIPFGLAVSIDHSMASKTLLQQLSHLGYCVSYDEIVRFKQSVLVSDKYESAYQSYPATFTQWVADNVDHNVRTLNGLCTKHFMGAISATVKPAISTSGCDTVHCLTAQQASDLETVTDMECDESDQSSALQNTKSLGRLPPGEIGLPCSKIDRISRRLLASEVVKDRGIRITQYHNPAKSGLSSLTLQRISSIEQTSHVKPPFTKLTFLWHTAALFSTAQNPRPNWGGFMAHVCIGEHSSPAVIEMMPLIDLNPSDETCVFSTLLFVMEQANKLGISSPCVTFDQPLWLKAVDIAKAEKLNIVCRLGGFHMLMSFLGSIGSLMSGSGLEEMFKINYGRDTVSHMLSGKAYARALRGHFLVEGALMALLLKQVAPTCNVDVTEVQKLYESVYVNKVELTNSTMLDSCASLLQLESGVTQLMSDLSLQCRTAKLWLQYMEYVSIVKKFLLAERTGNWQLHLESTHGMLNLFAATGHHNYAKCARLYLQLMTDLPVTHPDLYASFSQNGFHTVRRTDRFWGGLSTDLLIEQTMMKSLKSRAGLTRGRGMTESVSLLWTRTMHQCAMFHMAMKSLTGLETEYEQHAELGSSRKTRDWMDMQKVVEWLEQNNPFQVTDGRLRSIATGLTASDSDMIDCDKAESVGYVMQQNNDDCCFVEATYKRKDQVKTLLHLGSVCDSGMKVIPMDSTNLFHRLIILVDRSANIPSYFKYELTPMPTCIFKDGWMRKPDKSNLASDLIRGISFPSMPADVRYVADGGALLHRVKWYRTEGCTFSDIMRQYVQFVVKRFGKNAVVVFDGYQGGPSTKDHEHRRRVSKLPKGSPDVTFTARSPVVSDQSTFLLNASNKTNFIAMLMEHLTLAGCTTVQAMGDADTDIVSAALKLAASKQHVIAVSADDTDILVLLIHHLAPTMSDIFFISDAKKKSDKYKEMSIRTIQQKVGIVGCEQVLVAHAIGGCDTTSALFRHGKGAIFRKLLRRKSLAQAMKIMKTADADSDSVVTAGMLLMEHIFDGKSGDKLNKMRYSAYCKMGAVSLSRPSAERLPPTESAAHFHILRAHLQAVRWSKLNDTELESTKWGWKMVADRLEPITTDLPAAPDDVLNVVRCKCKSQCTSALCSCRKNGLSCVAACAHCHGDDCANADKPMVDSECSDNDDTDTGRELHDLMHHLVPDDYVFNDEDILWDLEEEV